MDWAAKIDANFERHYWIGEACADQHVNKRRIYKDTLGSSVPWADYQLRPNFLVALTLAPQMIEVEHALLALEQVRAHLMDEPHSLGIKTLDASDLAYCGTYDNGNNSHDPKVASGFNYHQGPEWLWPVGFYLRALLHYTKQVGGERHSHAIRLVKQHLAKLYDCLLASEWKSLPELTNRDGAECYFSCSSQAWSVATIVEVLNDLTQLTD